MLSLPIACPTRSRTEERPCWYGRGTPPQWGQIHPVMRVPHNWPPYYYFDLGRPKISQREVHKRLALGLCTVASFRQQNCHAEKLNWSFAHHWSPTRLQHYLALWKWDWSMIEMKSRGLKVPLKFIFIKFLSEFFSVHYFIFTKTSYVFCTFRFYCWRQTLSKTRLNLSSACCTQLVKAVK